MKPILHGQTKRFIELFLAHPAHAVAVVGDRGAGKDFLARYLASHLMHVSIDKLDNNAYFLPLGTSDELAGIEEVRRLHNFLSLRVPGTAAIRRCVVIREIEALGQEAQNALLKTLEEPPEDTVLICTVSERQQVPATIASRVQWLAIVPLAYQQVVDSFNSYQPADIDKAYYISQGNVGLLSALLRESGDHPMVASIQAARELLGNSSYQRMLRIDAITKDKKQDIAGLLDAFYRLLHAALQSAAKHNKQADIARLRTQISHVLHAQGLVESKVQSKLVLSWLFYSL